MPIEIINTIVSEGPELIPGWEQIKKFGPLLIGLGSIKYYFAGAINKADRNLHGKVYLVTGGTAGVGSEIAYDLAQKGAQVVLLVRTLEDPWLVEYVEDLRERSNNTLIYAEECDLNSLHSIRLFATKWLDNSPPRRVDGVICCASECLPVGKSRQTTIDGVEKQIGVNYLANFHLLTLLAPCIRSQPPDRDVRIVLASCSTQALGDIDLDDIIWSKKKYPSRQPWKPYGSSKLMLGLFAKEFQKQVDLYERKDGTPCNVIINLVNPGIMRSPSTRRFISMGSILGLFIYLLLFPIWFLFFKSSLQGAQSFLFALYDPVLRKLEGANMIQECKIQRVLRPEYSDNELQENLFKKTEETIASLEKQSAIERKKQEKLKVLQMLPEERKKFLEQQKNKKQDIHQKPDSPDGLQTKLDVLRKQLGVPSSSSTELPLFPENEIRSRNKLDKPSKSNKK